MGEMSDRVAEAAKTRRAALERGKHVAQDAADSATEQGQELVSSLQGARPGLARPCAQHGLEERARAWGPPRPTSGSCETQPPTMGLGFARRARPVNFELVISVTEAGSRRQ
jgi:hypothetical protein